ncbi:MAG TPA: PQQ-dependent sugar dehydrogenase, partial [Pirellulaceae bacterium]|nr:PQQ-dependent sugar dehydrogenase [Pirellulaceae bacterium]
MLNAVGLVWAADGTMFVVEKHGFVRVLTPGEQLQGLPFIDLSAEVNNNGDRGLLGIALSPGFVPDGGANSWVYLLYTVSPVPGQDMTYNQNNQYSFSRLVRYRAITTSGSIVADLATRQVLLGNQLADGSVPDCIASIHDSHSNGAIRFGTDGSLLLATGDGAHYDFQDNGGADAPGFDNYTHPQTLLRGPTPAIQDEGAFRSQDPRSLAGKILRLDPATGNGLPSNPFYDGNPASNRSRVFALGLRNPFRMNLVPGTGSNDPNAAQPGVLLIGDVGWNTWEELNACALAATNFGWPCFEGVPSQGGYAGYTSSNPNKVTCHTPVNGTFKSPASAWNHGTATAYYPPNTHQDDNGNPLTGFKGSCSIGGAIYTGGSYPAKYAGRLFIADYVGQWIKDIELDANWNVTKIHDFAANTGRLVSIERHPISGDLYAISVTTNKIIHIRYTQNYTPV